MPRQETVLRIFVASPSDVKPEREALESVVQEVNRTVSNDLSVRFELLRWEKDVIPAVGSDPQKIINSAIGDEYDLFVGIFWSRLGTPTPRARSGSEEEFERAYQRIRDGSSNIDLMLYFKDAAIAPSAIDIGQFSKVTDFKNRCKNLGLCSEFQEMEQFEALLRVNLSKIAHRWAKGERSVISPQAEFKGVGTDEVSADEEELGYLDYLELFEEKNAELISSLAYFGSATEQVTQNINKRTAELRQVNGSEQNSRSQARRIFSKASEDLDAFSSLIERQVPTLKESSEKTTYAISKVVSLSETDFGMKKSVELVSLETGVESMRGAAEGSLEGLREFRETIDSLPRFTSEFNRSKRRASRALTMTIDIIASTAASLSEILESLNK